MASLKQIAANRRNAKKSTGPKTPEGKQTVSQNPVQHGLLAVNPVCLPEEQEEHDQFVLDMRTQWRTNGFRELLALDRLIDCAWRLRRVTKIETSLLLRNRQIIAKQPAAAQTADTALGGAYRKANQCFVNLSRHERQLERSYQASLRELTCLQYARAMDRNPFYIANMGKQPALAPDAPRQKYEGHFGEQPKATQQLKFVSNTGSLLPVDGGDYPPPEEHIQGKQ
jgi:hypothetical protein